MYPNWGWAGPVGGWAAREVDEALELPNPAYRLPAGLKCKVRFPG